MDPDMEVKKVEAKKGRHDTWKVWVHKHVFFFFEVSPAFSELFPPYASLQQSPVITWNMIVCCRSCHTYINPFITFLDQCRWKSNLCYRANDGTSPVTVVYFPCSLLTVVSCFAALMLYAFLNSCSVIGELMCNPLSNTCKVHIKKDLDLLLFF